MSDGNCCGLEVPTVPHGSKLVIPLWATCSTGMYIFFATQMLACFVHACIYVERVRVRSLAHSLALQCSHTYSREQDAHVVFWDLRSPAALASLSEAHSDDVTQVAKQIGVIGGDKRDMHLFRRSLFLICPASTFCP